MNKNAVNWFEIPVNEMSRAKKFYETVFSLELSMLPMPDVEMAAFPMNEGGEHSTGALIKCEGYVPSKLGTMVYFTCDDVQINLDIAVKAGGKVLNPKTAIGEHGFIAHIEDSEGNRIGLHSIK